MLTVGFDGFVLEPNSPIALVIHHKQIRGIILIDYDFKRHARQRNIRNPAQLKRSITELQNMTKETDQYRMNSA
ncbi:hypothetical protein [Candidatus Williamhamiltonella defendens]|uniref:hypothetical protein n=1 Tax=Candidatus Williamhamiltonella defendens TaxID=138072 RepID=UPI0016510414|nr:hypothetical protein [Candidatus Hamiltonella defensa]